jgi:hypothetical protein
MGLRRAFRDALPVTRRPPPGRGLPAARACQNHDIAPATPRDLPGAKQAILPRQDGLYVAVPEIGSSSSYLRHRGRMEFHFSHLAPLP